MARRLDPETRRTQILDAAQQLFVTQGYEATRIDDVLAALEISKGGFYHHFRSKEDLVEALALREIDDLVTWAERQPATEPAAALESLIAAGSEWLSVETRLRTALDSFSSRSLYLQVIETAIEARLAPAFCQIIEAGIAAGQFRPVDSWSTLQLFLAVNAHANRHQVHAAWSNAEGLTYAISAFELLARHLGLENGFSGTRDKLKTRLEEESK